VKAREEEGDEAAPVRGSPELGWWQRGGVTVVEDGGRKLRIAWALERERERERWEDVRGGRGVKLRFL
jgi:hypothetical protein